MPTDRPMRLSAAAARRVALAAQGFADPAPGGAVTVRHLRRVLGRVGLLQIDSVNVLSRSHYLPVFARLGGYDRSALDALAHRRRELFEYWAHEASFVPIALYPHLHWRMQRGETFAWQRVRRMAVEQPGLIADVLAEITANGPLPASVFATERPHPPGTMWNWHDGKVAVEWLFATGAVSVAHRTATFERMYDVPERVIPAEVLAIAPSSAEDGQRELVRVAARAHGVGTERDLRDYFRMGQADTKARITELLDSGELLPVEVAGWQRPAFLHAEARMPRRVRARGLLSPFDSLIWDRARTERLFGLRFRIEIYTSPAQRVHGYYVLPFLLGEQLVALVDVKADRQAGVLRALGVHSLPGGSAAALTAGELAAELAAELRQMAAWLSLPEVQVAQRGDLAAALASALG